MGVLKFDGIDDSIKFSTLTSALSTVSGGAWTCAVLFRRVVVDSDWHGQAYLLSGTGNGTSAAGLSIANNNTVFSDVGSNTTHDGPDISTTTETYISISGKASGSAAFTYSRYRKSVNDWAHVTSTGTSSNSPNATMLQIGAWQNVDPSEEWLGLIGFWTGTMSNANRQALSTNWRTSDWWNSAHGQPKFLAQLNVAASSVTDLASNASGRTVTGTTLDNAETLSSFNFDGTGGGAALERSIGDTLTLADSPSTAMGRSISVPDTLTLSDSSSGSAGRNASVADTLTLADAQTISRGLAANHADTLTLADAQTIARNVSEAIADSLTLADAQTFERAVQRSLSDNLPLSDTVDTQSLGALQQNIADSLTLDDFVDLSSTVQRSLSDSVPVGDSTTPSQSHNLSVVDVLILADSATPSSERFAEIADALGLADSVTAVIGTAGAYIHHRMPLSGLYDSATNGVVVVVAADGTVRVVTAQGIVASVDSLLGGV